MKLEQLENMRKGNLNAIEVWHNIKIQQTMLNFKIINDVGTIMQNMKETVNQTAKSRQKYK